MLGGQGDRHAELGAGQGQRGGQVGGRHYLRPKLRGHAGQGIGNGVLQQGGIERARRLARRGGKVGQPGARPLKVLGGQPPRP